MYQRVRPRNKAPQMWRFRPQPPTVSWLWTQKSEIGAWGSRILLGTSVRTCPRPVPELMREVFLATVVFRGLWKCHAVSASVCTWCAPACVSKSPHSPTPFVRTPVMLASGHLMMSL